MKIPEGYVAVRASGGRVLLHLAAPPNGDKTACGRYSKDRYLPEDEEISDDTRVCEVDRSIAASQDDK